jgi:hypothetical protein
MCKGSASLTKVTGAMFFFVDLITRLRADDFTLKLSSPLRDLVAWFYSIGLSRPIILARKVLPKVSLPSVDC